MLTKSELEWLEARKNPCERCKSDKDRFCHVDCYDYYNYHMDFVNPYLEKPDYRDTAEFNERVAKALLKIDYEDLPCAHGMELFCPAKHSKGVGCGDWCKLRLARLTAEEEMGNAND